MKDLNTMIKTLSVASVCAVSAMTFGASTAMAEEITTLQMDEQCSVSPRGTRCRKGSIPVQATLDQAALRSVTVCSHSSRGSRCKDFNGGFLIADFDLMKLMADEKNCVMSKRGIRCPA